MKEFRKPLVEVINIKDDVICTSGESFKEINPGKVKVEEEE